MLSVGSKQIVLNFKFLRSTTSWLYFVKFSVQNSTETCGFFETFQVGETSKLDRFSKDNWNNVSIKVCCKSKIYSCIIYAQFSG